MNIIEWPRNSNKILLSYGVGARINGTFAYHDIVGLRCGIDINGISTRKDIQYVVSVSIAEVTAIRHVYTGLDHLGIYISYGLANSIQAALDLFTKLRAEKILRYAECFVPLYESTEEYEVIASLIPFTSAENIDIVLNALFPVADRYGEAIAMGLHRKEELGLYSQDNQNSLLL